MACCTRRWPSPVTKGSDARAQYLLLRTRPRVCLNACSSRFTGTLATHVPLPVTRLRHSSNGRPRKGTRKFTQEQVLSAIRRRTRWVTSLGLCTCPHDTRTTQDPVRAYHGSLLPAALGPRCSNTHQSLQLSPSARISSPTVSAC